MSKRDCILSIIIPTYNRAHILKKCLSAINEQQQVGDHALEIIVANDGSTDVTEEIVREFSTHSRWPVQYLTQKNLGANAARNTAIHHANGRLLLFINDDILPTPTMIFEHMTTHKCYPDDNIGVLGRVTIAEHVSSSPIAKLHLDASFNKLGANEWLDWRAFFTCNVSVKTNFLLQHGLFEESLRYHEDVELSERLSAFGLKLKYIPEALGVHDHYLKVDEFLQVAQRDGKALAVWYKKSPHLVKKLAIYGFYPSSSLGTKLKYRLADIIFNKITRPWFLALAQYYNQRSENISLNIYRKLYQAEKRKAVYDELHI